MRIRCFLVLMALTSSALCGPAEDARAIYDSVKGKFADGEAVSKNLQTPLTSGSPMTNMNGTKTFTAQIGCTSEQEFLSVGVSPTSTNDANILIQMDQDLDGTYEVNETLYDVSGVCRNGFVRCDPGTWSNCNHYSLTATPAITTTHLTEEDDIQLLFGCYCINDSCGTNLATLNADKISADVATTVATSIAQHDPIYIASKLDTAAGVTTYYGQSVRSCSTSALAAGDLISELSTAKQTDDMEALVALGQQRQATAAPGSLQSIATNQRLTSSTTNYTDNNCTIRRSMSYYTDDDMDTFISTVRFWSQGRNYIDCTYSLVTGDITCSHDGDTHQAEVQNLVDMDEWCNASTTVSFDSYNWWNSVGWGFSDTSVSTHHYQTPSCANNLEGRVRVSDNSSSGDPAGRLSRVIGIAVRKPTCHLREEIVNNCTAFETDCHLYGETVDEVETIRYGINTGFNPLPSTVHVYSAICGSHELRDWHLRERTYKCPQTPRPLNVDLSHLQEPIITGNTAQVTIGGETRTLTRPAVEIPACQETCEVSQQVVDDQANITGQTADGRTNPARTKLTIKLCENGACPLDVGETVVRACGCSNSFSKAISTMQMLRLAGQDFICTSGTVTTH